jgi:hypothetical protein
MITLENLALWLLISIAGSLFGGYLAGYLRKKGENLATHEDFQKILRQLNETTRATKSIEAKVSDESWEKQRRWEMKRDALRDVLQAYQGTENALVELIRIISRSSDDNPSIASVPFREALRHWQHKIDDFGGRRTFALIFCNRDTNEALLDMQRQLTSAAVKLADGASGGLEELAPELHGAIAKALACARREIGSPHPDAAADLP